MRSILTVTTPANDLALLSIEELRATAGVSDDSRDIELTALGLSIAASIMSECNIAVGIGGEPTLLQETLSETFYSPRGCELILSRRHNVAIASVTEDDALLVVNDDYLVNPESGLLSRQSSAYPSHWCARTVVVVYQAGFATVPADLKQAATDFFRATLAERSRDPFVKSKSVEAPGILSESTDYWVGSVPGQTSEGPVPDIVSGQLKRYRNFPIG